MWSSIRGRIIITVFSLAIVLFGFVYYSEQSLNNISESGLRAIQDQRTMRTGLDHLKLQLQRTESALFLYATLLDPAMPRMIKNRLRLILDSTHDMSSSAVVRRYPDLKSLVSQIKAQVHQLNLQSETLLRILSEAELRYPASKIAVETIQPSNFNFIRDVNLAIGEAREDKTDKALELWLELRYMWTQQISLFRLLIANRSGAFGDPARSMRINDNDRRLFLDAANKLIDRLQQLDRQEQLGFQQKESLQSAISNRDTFVNAANKVINIYDTERWRADAPFLQNHVRPTLESIWRAVLRFDRRLSDMVNDEVLQGLNASGKVTRYMYLFTAVVYILLVIGFLIFEYTIRRPMINMAHAMEAEGRGETVIPKLAFKTMETQILFDAFKNMQSQIRSRQLRLTTVLENARDGIVTINQEGGIESFNRGAEVLFAYNAVDAIGKAFVDLVPEEQYNDLGFGEENILLRALTLEDKVCTALAKRKDGNTFLMSLKISALEFQGNKLYIAVCADISETQNMIDRLRTMAERDHLTGLFNRYFLMETLEKTIQRREHEPFIQGAVMYVNLDHFKFINDTLGHQAGDYVLKTITKLLAKRIRKNDLLARIGADEFVILLSEFDYAMLPDLANSFCRTIADYQFAHHDVAFDVCCSVGVAILDNGITNNEEFLARADIACQLAKQEGRNRIHVFREQDRGRLDSMSTDFSIAGKIKKAIEQNRFVLVCQPILDVYNLEVRSYEVLIRMLDEQGQLLLPCQFLPSAERYGLMMEIDRWVINEAIFHLARRLNTHTKLHLSINLSAQSIMEPLTLETITKCIRESGVSPTALTFEVTESAAIENLQAAGYFLGKLQDLGCQTALDDFGVGYSSFAYLKELPVDYVKIDGSFVKDIATNRINRAMVKSMNDVAHALGKATVAEFVENDKILRMLKEMGIDMGQGFYLGEPLAIAQLLENIQAQAPTV